MVNLVSENGAQNAKRFVKVVKKLALESRHLILREDGGRFHDPDIGGWVWMANPDWRGMVESELNGNVELLDHIYWTEPDKVEGWTFCARSLNASSPVLRMGLNEALRPGPIARTSKFFAWVSKHPALVGSLLGLLALVALAAGVPR